MLDFWSAGARILSEGSSSSYTAVLCRLNLCCSAELGYTLYPFLSVCVSVSRFDVPRKCKYCATTLHIHFRFKQVLWAVSVANDVDVWHGIFSCSVD